MKKITAALFLFAIATPAFSADVGSLGSPADQGVYLGVTLGASKTDKNIGATTLTKTNGFVYGGILGYQFNKNFAVEGQYTGAGRFESTPVTAKNDALSLAAVGILPVSDEFSLYGKLGYANTRTTLTNNTALTALTGGTSRSAATYGLGAQYNATPSVGIRFGWDSYGSAIINNAGVKQNFNSSTLTVGAIFKL